MTIGRFMRHPGVCGPIFAASILLSGNVDAVPSFTRQSGQPCSSCHTVFPELTAFGRQFKLRGYAMSRGQQEQKPFPYSLPLSASLIASRTSIGTKAAEPAEEFPRANETIMQTAAVYYAGKLTDTSGAFVQYNYDGIERTWAVEMADIRYTGSGTIKGKELLWGVDINNAPTAQDVWNTMTLWSFPHLSDAGVMSPVSTLLDTALAQQVGGLGLYGFWDNRLYTELGFYRTLRSGVLRPLGTGTPTDTVVDGYNPYAHVMYNREWGAHSFAAGVHGMIADIFPDPAAPSGPTDRFRDVSLDVQYQHLGDTHTVSIQSAWVREQRDWNASFPLGRASNASDVLNTFRTAAHYWYRRTLGGGIGYFATWGDSDRLAYGDMAMTASAMGNTAGSPEIRGWIVALDWLPLPETQTVKLGLRYTRYDTFNGARANYNGFGRDASDNNALFVYGWLLF